MLLELFLKGVTGLAMGFLSIFPRTTGLPQGFIDALNYIQSGVQMVGNLIPLNTVLTALQLVFQMAAWCITVSFMFVFFI